MSYVYRLMCFFDTICEQLKWFLTISGVFLAPVYHVSDQNACGIYEGELFSGH